MIPYNPSSFNSNKTILEQILEIKKWLIAHPSYAVYTTYIHYKPAENVDYFFTEINGDPDFVDNIAVGDLLWFGDGYISPIASITIDPNDRENSYVTISQPVTSLIGPTGPQGPRGYDGVSVTNASVNASGYLIITLSNGLTVNTGYVVGPQGTTGPEGPEGPQGPSGPTGVSITNVAINGNSHLIVTLSDGSTIDAGSVSSGGFDSYVTLTSSSGTLSDADYNKLLPYDSVIVYFNNVLTKVRDNAVEMVFDSNYGTQFGITRITITKSTKAYTYTSNKIDSRQISSGSSTNGQVLTSDGSGGTYWQNASGGVDIVDITSSSGTLTDEEYNKLTNPSSIIRYGSSVNKRYLQYAYDTSTHIYYEYTMIDKTYGDLVINQIDITKSTKAYILNIVNKVIDTLNINSGSATNGQVLTADGSGNARWQTPSGSTLYEHNITLDNGNGTAIYYRCINNTATAYDITSFRTYMIGKYDLYKNLIANGTYNKNAQIVAIQVRSSTDLAFLYATGSSILAREFALEFTSTQFSDNVVAL